jgi:hypothetical protein
MKNDEFLIFEAYYNNILNEAPIGADYEDIHAATSQAVTSRGGDTYLFADLMKKTGKSAEEVIEMIVKPVYDALFPGGRFDAEGSEKEQLASLQDAIHSELVHLGYPKARAGYTARIIKNAVTPAVKFLNDKAAEGEDIAHNDIEDAVVGSIEHKDDESETALKAAPAQHTTPTATQREEPAAVEGGHDRELERLRSHAVELVGADNIKEADLLAQIKQAIVNNDSEVSDVRAKGKATGVINSLVNAGVLSRRNGIISAGDKADEYAEKGDLSQVSAEPEEYLANTGLHGGRTTTGRQTWGGEGGGRYGVDFG